MEPNPRETEVKLLPCPFCKSKDVMMMRHIYYGWKCFTPFCKTCEAKGQVNIRYEADAAKKWNSLTLSQQENQRLRDALEEASNTLDEFGARSDDTRVGWTLLSIDAALNPQPHKG